MVTFPLACSAGVHGPPPARALCADRIRSIPANTKSRFIHPPPVATRSVENETSSRTVVIVRAPTSAGSTSGLHSPLDSPPLPRPPDLPRHGPPHRRGPICYGKRYVAALNFHRM